MCKGDLEALVPHRALGVGDCKCAGHGGADEIERKFRSSQQGLERDFKVERVGSKVEKTTIVVVLVIGPLLGHGGSGERNRESDGKDGGSGEREIL